MNKSYPPVRLITDTAELREFCGALADAAYVTVDTEFVREKTYWPQLCLIQMAGPSAAACIDPLADGLDLEPVRGLFANPKVLKVFHAARQDLEIFCLLFGTLPAPLFDTQIAAMVCGFGESVGYETLAQKIVGEKLDKTMRFTDWARRPLSDRQLAYALADVTHLRDIYASLSEDLAKSGREDWLKEEMAVLSDPETYRNDPDSAWLRLKPRSRNGRFLMVLKALAAWREREAQARNMPRQRVVRDDALLEIAANLPRNRDELGRSRALSKGVAEGKFGAALLETVESALAQPRSAWPQLADRDQANRATGPAADLLKVLLKKVCEDQGVAQKLVASTADIEILAADPAADIPALRGWRRKLYGEQALRLLRGELALKIAGSDQTVETVDL